MKFLVDSSSSLGDVIIDVPLFRAIVRQGHYLEVLVGAKVVGALADCDFIGAVREKGTGFISKLAAVWKATRSPWDVILYSSPGKPISFLGGAAVRRNASHRDRSQYPHGAIIYRLSILEGLVEDWYRSIETRIPYRPERLALALHAAGISSGEPYLTVAPGTAKKDKQWPIAGFVEVVRAIREDFAHVVIVGSPEESRLCQQVAAACGVVSTAGKIDLTDACALVSHAAKHLGNDSGLGHVAAGNGVATVAIGGDDCGHYRPWRQTMLRGAVSSISSRKVIDALRFTDSQ